MSDPGWIASPLAAELEVIVTQMRNGGQVAQHVSLRSLLDSWRGLVEKVEVGYAESVYEYANDVDSRKILERVAASARPQAREALIRWLRPWDRRYEQATVKASAPFHGRAEAAGPSAASPWHWRIPRRLVGELRADLEDMGIA
jgi:hypothetical protein